MSEFVYGEIEMNALKSKDKKLGEWIDEVGWIRREVNPDLFTGLIESIMSQQISGKAAETVCRRLKEKVEMTPLALASLPVEEIQSVGISMRKANNIKTIATSIVDGSFPIHELDTLPDEEVIERLSSLPGVGRWTAEMLLIFSLQRKNVLSYADYALKRGMMILYHHRKITPVLFERYRRRYSPYGSVASFYLWELSNKKSSV